MRARRTQWRRTWFLKQSAAAMRVGGAVAALPASCSNAIAKPGCSAAASSARAASRDRAGSSVSPSSADSAAIAASGAAMVSRGRTSRVRPAVTECHCGPQGPKKRT